MEISIADIPGALNVWKGKIIFSWRVKQMVPDSHGLDDAFLKKAGSISNTWEMFASFWDLHIDLLRITYHMRVKWGFKQLYDFNYVAYVVSPVFRKQRRFD